MAPELGSGSASGTLRGLPGRCPDLGRRAWSPTAAKGP